MRAVIPREADLVHRRIQKEPFAALLTDLINWYIRHSTRKDTDAAGNPYDRRDLFRNIRTVDQPTQLDSYNCGVFVLAMLDAAVCRNLDLAEIAAALHTCDVEIARDVFAYMLMTGIIWNDEDPNPYLWN